MNKETLETLLKSATPEVITKYAMQIVEAGTKIVAVRPHVVKVRESSENILAKSDDLAFAFTTITDALKAQFGADLAKADESVKKAVTEATATITALGKAAEEMTTQMDDVEGSVEDAAAAAGDETDKGLNAAATAKKRYDRQFLAHKRETDRQLDQMRKAQELSTVTILGGIEKMLTASLGAPAAVAAPASGAPTAVITKSEDGAQGETVQKQAPTGVPRREC